MELVLKNKLQHVIANLLWNAKSTDEVNAILAKFGRDAQVVHDMMVAAYLDDVTDVDLAKQVLKGL